MDQKRETTKKIDQLRDCLILVLMILGLGSCASPGKGTGIGAGAGAATGAIIGGATEGWKGAGLGAALGAAAGGGIGNVLDRQTQELNQVAEAKRTREGILVNLKNDLLFDTGSAVLKDSAINDISKLGDILVKYPKDRIRIEGFTDSVGRPSFNEELSMKRADAVQNVLRGRGVKESQMTVLGFGESKPIASNSTAQGRSQNRRVELHIEMPQAKA